MFEVSTIISKFALRKSSKGYRTLCLILQEAVRLYPQDIPLEQLCLRIQKSAGGASSKSLQRALGRTIDMIWECTSNHELLNQIYQYPVHDKPSTKDFIYSFVDYYYVKNSVFPDTSSCLRLNPTLSPYIFRTSKGHPYFVLDFETKISPHEICQAIDSIQKEKNPDDKKPKNPS